MIQTAHPEWHDMLRKALECVNPEYVRMLKQDPTWLPGLPSLFAAFQWPLSKTRFILLGESPYPRKASANGYAFWDASVQSLWSETGFSKPVNKATSMRNFLKMLLHARGDLQDDFSQSAIAGLDHTRYCQTAHDLFHQWLKAGFLLLNASLVYRSGQVPYDARQWRPFMSCLLQQLAQSHPSLSVVVFGRVADKIPEVGAFHCMKSEHPYHLSFITNPNVLDFFRPFDLLRKRTDDKLDD